MQEKQRWQDEQKIVRAFFPFVRSEQNDKSNAGRDT